MGTNLNKQNDFYIGWQPEAPDAFSRKVKRFIWVLIILVPLISAMLVLGQRGFTGGVFEFGQLTEIEGILVKSPVPMIKVMKAENEQKVESILLVGFGKTGADSTLSAIEKLQKKSLDGKMIKIRGTLIYHNHKKILELTEGIESFIGVNENLNESMEALKDFGKVHLKGEIYDPKCAFGAMKPGYGKPHRSCAVRCISGGVPPILRIKNSKGEANYCLMLGLDGKTINNEVLEYIADQVSVCGHLEQKDDWLVLYTDPSKDIFRIQPHWMKGDFPMCTDL